MKLTKVKRSFQSAGYRVIQVLGLGKNDVQTAEQVQPFGFDSSPVPGFTAITAKTQNNSDNIVIGYISNQITLINEGESIVYSFDGDIIQSTITLRINGTIEFFGTGDNLVRYSKLKEEYDKTKEVLDTILTVLQTPVNELGNGSPSAFQAALLLAIGSKTTGDISSSKIDELKIPD